MDSLFNLIVLFAFICAACWLLNAAGEIVVQQRRGQRLSDRQPNRRRSLPPRRVSPDA
jgi:hypothetical protein